MKNTRMITPVAGVGKIQILITNITTMHRLKTAILFRLRTKAGRTICQIRSPAVYTFRVLMPPLGNNCNFNENIITMIIAIQNGGTDIPR